jgi:hypothetical protein
MSEMVTFQGTFSTGPETFYAATPPGVAKFRVVGGRLTCMSGGAASAETVTISANSVTLGVFTLSTTVAGTSVSYVPNASTGNTITTVGDASTGCLVAVGSSMTSTVMNIILELDDSVAPLT